MPATAYIIITDDGVDQIAESKSQCARELRALRDTDHCVVASDWDKQDDVVAMLDELRIEGFSVRTAARRARAAFDN